jgi:hypothetical protein
VDGRDKPGHDDKRKSVAWRFDRVKGFLLLMESSVVMRGLDPRTHHPGKKDGLPAYAAPKGFGPQAGQARQ